MIARSFLICWLVCLAVQVGFAAVECSRRPPVQRSRRPLYAAAAASVVPLLILVLIVRIFVIGRTATFPQGNAGARMELWSLWAEAWPLLMFGNLLAFVTTGVAIFTGPWGLPSVLSRMAAIGSVWFGWAALLRWAPTA